MFVHSLTFTPPARFDNVPWNRVRVEIQLDGEWQSVETLALDGDSVIPSGLDADPADPQERQITTTESPEAEGTFRVVWLDADDAESPPSESVQSPGEPTSAGTVGELRRMTGVRPDEYTVGGITHWTDDQLAGVIANRVSARLIQLPMTLVPSMDGEGKVIWTEARIPRFSGTLDTGSVVITDLQGAPITGVTVHADGRVTFASDQGALTPLASGLAYDLNGAAADVLTEWASAMARGYDVRMDGQQLSRSKRHEQLLKQAEAFRAKSLPSAIRLTRRDVRSGSGGRLADRLALWFDQWGR